MKDILLALTFVTVLNIATCFTKYGRSCKDIGCPSTQECVMASDPCSYYQREGECGSYPTCKKKSSSGVRTCSTYVCPPSQVCKMDGGHPKCFDDSSKSGHVGYDTHSANAPLNPSRDTPSAPPAEGGSHNIYPQVPKGETTPRPNIRPGSNGGGGYQGGRIGSGYPGYPQQGGGYPQQGGGYPQQGGGYPQQGNYPQGGYQGYPGQGGYQQQYPGYQNGYNPYQQQYPQKAPSGGSSITDKISAGLKSLGLFYVLFGYYQARAFRA